MKECEIRPKEIFDRYLELSRQDALVMQKEQGQFIDISCPACGLKEEKKLFLKNNFQINQCISCGSIYCSPRPSEKLLGAFYADSPSARYWSKEFFPTVAEIRREKMFKPKAKQIFDMFNERNFIPKSICDIGAGLGLLLEEIGKVYKEAELLAVEPSVESAAVLRDKGFMVLEKAVEDAFEWKEKAELVTCFEVIEHVFSPKSFIQSIFNLVKPGGYCLITGLGGDGFDIQLLGRESKSIFPPHHLNFMSVKGLKMLFESIGFADVEITTPGKLDVDIVRNTLDETGSDCPLFFETLIKRGPQAMEEFQQFLVKHKLSSHVWILAKKEG